MLVKNIDRKIYDNEVIQSGQPALLCFFKETAFYSQIFASIEELSRQFEFFQFFIVQEEEHSFFFKELNFFGTPNVFFFVNGRVRGRLIGSVSTARLLEFIVQNINELKGRHSQCPTALRETDLFSKGHA